MTKLEKVLKGLEACIKRDCRENACPYGNMSHGCLNALYTDALELLKEREPRVLTLEEVKAFDWDYCYLEEERLLGKEYRAICGDYALTCITWPSVASMRILHGDNNYGKKWRCWTARPTDERREAVKWNDEA